MKICKSIVGALATFLLLGVSSVHSTTAYVQMMDVGGFSFFVPGLCSVGVGDTVRWSNVGVYTHTSTSGMPCTLDGIWNTGDVTPGNTSMPVVFPTAGFFLYFCIYQCDSMVGLVVVGNFPGVEEREIPSYRFNLFSVTPNPFIGSTTIRYSLPTESPVKMEVYDVVGRRVKTLRIFLEEAGEKEVEWDGRDERGQRLNTGIYFIRMETFGFQSVQKVILLQ